LYVPDCPVMTTPTPPRPSPGLNTVPVTVAVVAEIWKLAVTLPDFAAAALESETRWVCEIHPGPEAVIVQGPWTDRFGIT
jgi:hypothetical protein